MEPEYIEAHFIPLALDTYFRGNSQELAFCESVGAGGNHLVAATAGGLHLGGEGMLFLRERELTPVLEEFRALPGSERQPELPDPATADPPKRPVPQPPAGGLVIRGYCCYLTPGSSGSWKKSRRFYYELNPDRWAVETQSDMLWLTRDEMRLLAPKVGTPGETITVPGEICARFFGTLGIDYMEGSVNALPVRDSRMTLTVQSARGSETVLRIEGLAEMGVPFESHDRGGENSRGSVLRVAGEAVYDTDKGTFTGFSVAGAGRAWGNKMNYINREIGIGEYPWHYGIAWELVTGDAPMDRIPPYNLLHYGTGEPYFGARGEPAGGH